jgi:general secretion pathway protein I
MRAKRVRSEAGFSLVETVAAMGILAMAAIPLLQISSDATRNTAALETRLLARTVGENVMALAMVEPNVLDGGIQTGTQTQLGRQFAYSLTVVPAQPGGLQALEVQVRLEGEDTQVLSRLVSLKAVPLPLAPVEDEDGGTEGEGEPS